MPKELFNKKVVGELAWVFPDLSLSKSEKSLINSDLLDEFKDALKKDKKKIKKHFGGIVDSRLTVERKRLKRFAEGDPESEEAKKYNILLLATLDSEQKEIRGKIITDLSSDIVVLFTYAIDGKKHILNLKVHETNVLTVEKTR